MKDLKEKLNDVIESPRWKHLSDGGFEADIRHSGSTITYKVEPVFDEDGEVEYRALVEAKDANDKELHYSTTENYPVKALRSLILDTADITEKITDFNPV